MRQHENLVFRHYRQYDDYGVMQNGGVTVAIGVVNGVLKAGFSFCNPKDTYNKAIGRDKAAGRLYKEHPLEGEVMYLSCPVSTNLRTVEGRRAVFTEIEDAGKHFQR